MDKNICPRCVIAVLDSEKGILCNTCERWFHVACLGMSSSEYKRYADNEHLLWNCGRADCSKTGQDSLLRDILNKLDSLATKSTVTTISNDITAIREQLVQVNDKLTSFEPRICESEKRIKLLEDEVKSLRSAENSGSNIETVIEEFHDRERRSRNVILYNIPESKSKTLSVRIEHDNKHISELTSHFGSSELDYAFKSYRIGRPSQDKARPLKVVFRSVGAVMDFCKNFQQTGLRNLNSDLHSVSLSRDRTPTERKHLNELRDTLKARTDNGETDLTIKFVNGVPKIVQNKPKN